MSTRFDDVRQSPRYRTPESRLLDRAVSMERWQRIRHTAIDILLGSLFGLVLLVFMAAPWDWLS